jgi:hypothetical protein
MSAVSRGSYECREGKYRQKRKSRDREAGVETEKEE